MKLLYVVQRYGHEVAGGAERHCREFATRLAQRGHHVEALTSCATSYVDWANAYPEGTSDLDGVVVHRLPVRAPREHRFFDPLNRRVVWGRKPVPMYLQRAWMESQGPLLPDLEPWLAERAADYDAVIFFTYLYYTTWAGLPPAAAATTTVLHPTAHDEPPLYLPLFDATFRLPSLFAFSTPEEARLVRRRYRGRGTSKVIGVGVDMEEGSDVAAFRDRFGLGDRPYLVYVGRLDPAKGADELFEFFTAYKRRARGQLALVMVGDPVKEMPADPDVIVTGFVDDETKHAAMAGALAFMQPSYFESFSMVLAEAWGHRKPALVQGHCDVLVGQARRSGGGIPYRGFAEFEAAVDLIANRPDLASALGERGHEYVRANYTWTAVMDRYEAFLHRGRGYEG